MESGAGEKKMESNLEVVYFWIMTNQGIVSKRDRTKSRDCSVLINVLKIINKTKNNNLTTNSEET